MRLLRVDSVANDFGYQSEENFVEITRQCGILIKIRSFGFNCCLLVAIPLVRDLDERSFPVDNDGSADTSRREVGSAAPCSG
jgi:hypothetical protein